MCLSLPFSLPLCTLLAFPISSIIPLLLPITFASQRRSVHPYIRQVSRKVCAAISGRHVSPLLRGEVSVIDCNICNIIQWVPFQELKRPARDVDHPPPSSVEVKERVELYLYSLSGPSWSVLG
jgi:hypothetical protein